MALPESSSEESKLVADHAEVAKEEEEEEMEESPCSIDPRLVDALQHPRLGRTLLHMESKIQQVMANPDILQVEFLQCISSRLRMLASVLAVHYGLEPDCTESTRVFAIKKPDSRIPSVTLSGIAKFNLGDKPTIPIEKGSADASSSNLCAPEMTEPEKRAKILEEREEEKPNGNLFVPELTKPEKMARTLVEAEKSTSDMYAQETTEEEESVTTTEDREEKPISDLYVPEKRDRTLEEEKPTSNIYAQETTEEEKRVSTTEERKEERPISDYSAPEKTESEKDARTLEEKKKEKPTSNISAQDRTTEEGMEEKPISYSSAPEKTELGKGARISEKEKPPTSVDQRLADGVRHPKFGKILLSMEVKIQQAIQNPNLQKVEFPQCSSTHLRRLAGILALHYGLEPHCTESTRVFATKKPDSRIPSITLSGIAKFNPGDKLTIPIEKGSANTSSSNLCAPEMSEPPEKRARILEDREEEKPNGNLSVLELTKPEKRAKTLEEEEKPTSNMVSAQEMTEADKRKEEKPINNLSALEKTESEEDARTLEERKEEISNLSAPEKTEPENKVARTLEERKEKKPLTSVELCLSDAVRHPKFGKILHSMEVKIQQFMQNSNLQEVEFPQCSSAHLRRLAGLLALYYGLEPHCNEGIRVFARKKADSRIPLVTLSEIPKYNPGDKLTIPFEKHSGGASSSNLSPLEATNPELRARSLEECREEKPNMCPPEMSEPKKRAITFEEMDEKQASNLSAPGMSEADLSTPTMKETKEEKVASNLSADEMMEAVNGAGTLEKRKEEDELTISIQKHSGDVSSSNPSVHGMSEPEMMTVTIKEREEEVEPAISIDPRLADAVKDPQVCKILLSIEAKMQQIIQNPNLQEVEFPECSSSHLMTLSGILALHYGLEPHCTIRVYARKKPESRIPSVTLSGIPKIIPKDKLDIPIEKYIDSASSSNLSTQGTADPEERPGTLKKKKKRKKYDKARESIFNEPASVVSSSKSALISSSTFPVVSRSIPPIVPSFISPEVSSSTSAVASKTKSPAVLSSISPVEPSYKSALISSFAYPVVPRSKSPVVPRYSPPVVSTSISSPISSSISAVASQSKSPVVSSSMSPVVSSYKSALMSSSTPPVFSSSMFPVVSRSIPPVVSTSISSIVSGSTSTAVSKSKYPVVSSCKPKLMSSSRAAVISNSISPVPKSKSPLVLKSKTPMVSKSRYRLVSSTISPVVSSYKSASVLSSTSPVVSRSMPPAVSRYIPPVVSNSMSPVVSSSIPPVVSDSKPAVDSSSIPPVVSTSFAPVVSSSVSPVVSNFIPPVVESSRVVASLSPAISSSISAVVSNSTPTGASSSVSTVCNSTEGSQDNSRLRHEAVHSPSSNLNSSTRSVNRRGRGISHQGNVTDQHPQEMQSRESVSQPASTSPYMLTPYGSYNESYPYYASGAMYYPPYSNFTQWPLEECTETYYAPADPFFTQQSQVRYATQPCHASGDNLAYSSSTQCPPVQYMAIYDASEAMYKLAYSSYNQRPLVQYTQSFDQESIQYGATPSWPSRSSGSSVQDTSSEQYLSE